MSIAQFHADAAREFDAFLGEANVTIAPGARERVVALLAHTLSEHGGLAPPERRSVMESYAEIYGE